MLVDVAYYGFSHSHSRCKNIRLALLVLYNCNYAGRAASPAQFVETNKNMLVCLSLYTKYRPCKVNIIPSLVVGKNEGFESVEDDTYMQEYSYNLEAKQQFFLH